MMKKYKLRKWFKYLLLVVAYLSFTIMCSECEDTIMFIISHLASAVVFAVTVSLLQKY